MLRHLSSTLVQFTAVLHVSDIQYAGFQGCDVYSSCQKNMWQPELARDQSMYTTILDA